MNFMSGFIIGGVVILLACMLTLWTCCKTERGAYVINHVIGDNADIVLALMTIAAELIILGEALGIAFYKHGG